MLVALVAALPTVVLLPAAAAADEATAQVDPAVSQDLADDGRADFVVRFGPAPDLSAAYGMADWTRRGHWVVGELRAAADRAQHDADARLTELGVDHDRLWITNAIVVRGGTGAVVDEMAARPEVERIDPSPTAAMPELGPAEAGVEWGIADIGADRVWDDLGVRGDGIVIGSIDTGVQFDHPALVGSYRGNDGHGGFVHDHNWYDPAGDCVRGDPCDDIFHGTYTLGIAVGDGGAGNHIGVAPGARWIAAKACGRAGCTYHGLFASAQWMLAPTDLAGEHPDPSLRPHVVNMALAFSTVFDDAFRDVLAAWDAAGILGVFANGNTGFYRCETVMAPASLPGSYGIGAYGPDGRIAPFSSLGPSPVDGSVRPGITGPGVDVRSSIPGGFYETFSGTSAAAAHVTGSAALVLAAAPDLRGQPGAVREILDVTARDAAATEGCGGDATHNNTYGEGRLDAFAAVDTVAGASSARLTGTVTDAATGAPIPGAVVRVGGTEGATGSDGAYRLVVPAGAAEATYQAFGYEPVTRAVTLPGGSESVEDVALVAQAAVTVTGTVRDRSGHGWPLYARIDVDGGAAPATYTDPALGTYELRLPVGPHTITATPVVAGYETATREVAVESDDQTVDLDVAADPTCTAPGYVFGGVGLREQFDDGVQPVGWTQDSHNDEWFFVDHEPSNRTGGAAGFATADVNYDPLRTPSGFKDLALITPPVDLSTVGAPFVRFREDLTFRFDESFDVDVSIDGGDTWTTVRHVTGDNRRGPRVERLDLPMAAHEPDVRVRWRLHAPIRARWWQIDDVVVAGDPTETPCELVPGGLVTGQVGVSPLDTGFEGIEIRRDGSSDATSTIATPLDPARTDGTYVLFVSETGPQPLTATLTGLAADHDVVDVVANDTVAHDFELRAGHLVVDRAELTGTATLGGTTTATLTVTNDGDAPVTFRLHARARGEDVTTPGGTATARQIPLAGPSPLQIRTGESTADAGPATAGTDGAGPAATPTAPPWETAAGYPVRVESLVAVEHDGLVYGVGGATSGGRALADLNIYDPASDTWRAGPPMASARVLPSAAWLDDRLYVFGGVDDRGDIVPTLEVFDPSTGTWSAAAAGPPGRWFGSMAAVGGHLYVVGGCRGDACTPTRDVFRYDPAEDAWTTVASYPEPMAAGACGAIEGAVYCAGGVSSAGGSASRFPGAYWYDAEADNWTAFPSPPGRPWYVGSSVVNGSLVLGPGLEDFGLVTNRVLRFDPVDGHWVDLPGPGTVTVGAGFACGAYRVGGNALGGALTRTVEHLPGMAHCSGDGPVWLVQPADAITIEPGQQAEVPIELDARSMTQPGTFSGILRFEDDTALRTEPVPVTFTVDPPPTWGAVSGRVQRLGHCDTATPGAGARTTVTVAGTGPAVEVLADADGHYVAWLDAASAPVTVTAEASGWATAAAGGVAVSAGRTTTVDPTMRLAAGCVAAEPGSADVAVSQYAQVAVDLTIANRGAAPVEVLVEETAETLAGVAGRVDGSFNPGAAADRSLPEPTVGAGTRPPWFRSAPFVGTAAAGVVQCDGDADHVYVFSGVTGQAITDNAWRYDAARNAWSQLAAVPEPVIGPAATCEGGRIHLLGGEVVGEPQDAHWVYDIAGNSWQEAAPVPHPVVAAAAGAWEGRVYLVGGYQTAGSKDQTGDVEVFDAATDTWTVLPEPMPQMAAASQWLQAGRYLYVVGGQTTVPGEISQFPRTTQRLDLATGSWSSGPPLPAGRDLGTLLATDGALYAAGGRTETGELFPTSTPTALRLDLRSWPSGSWEPFDRLDRAYHAAGGSCTEAITGGEIGFVGGYMPVLRRQSPFTLIHGVAPERCPTIRSDVPWLTVDGTRVTVDADGSAPLHVTIDATSLPPGHHEATLLVTTTAPGAAELRLPVRVDVAAAPAPVYLTVQQPATIGGVAVADEDVVRIDGSGAARVWFDGSDVGLGPSTLDAAAPLADGSLVLSFAEATTVVGIGGPVDDEDLVRFVPAATGDETGGVFSRWFDGSDAGLDADGEDVDAVEVLADGRLLVSTDGDVRVPGVRGQDHDVLVFAPDQLGDDTAGAWALHLDGEDVGLSTPAEDVDAVAVRDDGALLLSTAGTTRVPGVDASDEDVLAFLPTSLGGHSAGTFTLAFDGSAVGLASNDVTGFGVFRPPPPAPAAAPGAPDLAPATPAAVDPVLEERFADPAARSDLWIELDATADLSGAAAIEDWAARGEYVVERLQATAAQSQSSIVARLRAQGADFTAVWVTNAVYVRDADRATFDMAVQQPEVRRVRTARTFALPEPRPAEATASVGSVEWGVADIGADDVWAQLGVTGQDVVVGSIDTGVQWDHPALAGQYRGVQPDGSVVHDYSWFDPSEQCGSFAPCDDDSHGTHTTGTMVGADGSVEHIGVAPGAQWIAAKGCGSSGCSDFALIASGQWMLAPTMLNGSDPDPARRPVVVNNSWGSDVPDPFYDDVVRAWVAAGIFPAFANGNSGFGVCSSVGSPADGPDAYGVGAYDRDGDIASFSSLGPSTRGDGIRPGISAPGVAVRSSVPGGYATFSGTSMATPHLAGAVALLVSAAPDLRGDVPAIEALLDGTARDSADTTGCGGTAADNNTFGEGRLDALTAVLVAPRGETGTLAGVVTDAATGEPLAGAHVTLAGAAGSRTLVAATDGSFRAVVSAGTYEVTARIYGWRTESRTVELAPGATVAADLALDVAPVVTVRGTVVDSGAHGWPLYARVDVAGYPGGPVYTDPVTGEYAVDLAAGETYDLTVTATLPGYESVTRPVAVGDGPASPADVALPLTAECAAPGYGAAGSGLAESFDTGVLPEGWTVTDELGSGQVWRFDDPKLRGNLTGGSAGFAIVDSDFEGGMQDTTLVSPVVDLSGEAAPVIRFRQDLRGFATETFDVDLSLDGGDTWENVWRRSADFGEGDLRGPRTDEIPIPTAAHQADVRVRFHYYDADFAWWWQVDDVQIGGTSCDPIPGGLVVGSVTDGIRGGAVDGAIVAAGPGRAAVSRPTPDDPGEPDGFYELFVAVDRTSLVADKEHYGSTEVPVAPVADRVVRVDIGLRSGALVVDGPAEGSATLGETTTATFTVTNAGTADATFAPRPPRSQIGGAGGLEPRWVTVEPLPHPQYLAAAASTPDGTLYVAGGYDETFTPTRTMSIFDPATGTWSYGPDLPEAVTSASASFVDGRLYVLAGAGELGTLTPAVQVYDPVTGVWELGPPLPFVLTGAAVVSLDGQLYVLGGCLDDFCTLFSDALLRFDPATDTWTTLAPGPYPAGTAYASCGAPDGELVCAGGFFADVDTFAYDPATDSWERRAPLPIPLWGAASATANGQLLVSGGVSGPDVSAAGFAYSPFADEWVPLPDAPVARFWATGTCGMYVVGGVASGGMAVEDVYRLDGFDDCDDRGAAWAAVDPATTTLGPGESTTVTVALDASAAALDQPGTYQAVVELREDTPGTVEPAVVRFAVAPPAGWGRVTGSVTAVERCDAGAAPLPTGTVSAGDVSVGVTDGTYVVWVDPEAGPVDVTATAPGYVPATAPAVTVAPGGTATRDLAVRVDEPCARVEPAAVTATVDRGSATTVAVDVGDAGARELEVDIAETPFPVGAPLGPPEPLTVHAAAGVQSVSTPASGDAPVSPVAPASGAGAAAEPAWFLAGLKPHGGARFATAQCDGDPTTAYLFGGTDLFGEPTADAYRFDSRTNTYTALARMPAPLEGAAAVCEAGRIHVLGGSGTTAHFVYDLARNEWLGATPLPRPVWGAAAAAWAGRVFLVGGDGDFDPGGTSGEVDVYDVASGTWSVGPAAMPAPAAAAGAAQAGPYLYVAGGWDDHSPATNVSVTQRLDLRDGTWSLGPGFAPATADFALVATDGALYAVGGDRPGGGFFDDSRAAYRLGTGSWPAGEWTSTDPIGLGMSANRGFCTEGFLGQEVWSIGGIDSYGFSDGEAFLHRVRPELCATVRSDVPWLHVDADRFVVDADGSRRLAVTVDAADLEPGVHEAALLLSTTDPGAPELRVPVTVTVVEPRMPLLSIETATRIGGVRVADEDIVALGPDGAAAASSLYFDGSDVGLAGAAVDAFAVMPDGSLVLSFADPERVPDVGAVDDSDLVRFEPTSLGARTSGRFTLLLDGDTVGLDTDAEDIGAVDVLADGRVVLATRGTASLGGMRAEQGDLLVVDPTSGAAALYLDGDTVGLSGAAEVVDAVDVGDDGTVSLSTTGRLHAAGFTAEDEDVVVLTPSSGAFALRVVGAALGLASTDVTGFETARATGTR